MDKIDILLKQIEEMRSDFKDHKRDVKEIIKITTDNKDQTTLIKAKVDYHSKELSVICDNISKLSAETEVVRFFSKNKKLATASLIGSIMIITFGVMGSISKIGEFIPPREDEVKTEIIKE